MLSPTRNVSICIGVGSDSLDVSFGHDTDWQMRRPQDHLKGFGLLKPGQLVVIVTGKRLGSSLGTELVKVNWPTEKILITG